MGVIQLDVVFNLRPYEVDRKAKETISRYFETVEIKPYSQVEIVNCLGKPSSITSYDPRTLYIFNMAVPDELKYPLQEIRLVPYRLPKSEYCCYDERKCVSVKIPSDAVAGKYDFQYATDTDGSRVIVAVRKHGSNKLWLTHNVFNEFGRIEQFLDYVLPDLFTSFRKLEWDELSPADQLKYYYNHMKYLLNRRIEPIALEINELEDKLTELRNEMKSIKTTRNLINNAKDRVRALTINDPEMLLDVFGLTNKVTNVSIEPFSIKVELEGLKLGRIPLPPFVVTIRGITFVYISLRDVSSKNPHPHVDQESPRLRERSQRIREALGALDLATGINERS